MQALVHQRGMMPAMSRDLPAEASRLLTRERGQLSAAELFYVDEDMTRLALAAAEK